LHDQLHDQVKLLQLAVVVCLIIIVAVAASGFVLYHQAGIADQKVSALQRSAADLRERIERVTVLVGGTTTGVVRLLQEQGHTREALARIDAILAPRSSVSPNPIVQLKPDEMDGLRVYFKLTRKAGEATRFKLGDKIPALALKPTPDIVFERLAPQLKGTRFLIDQNGALVVAAGDDNAVVLIVEPA
jgi:hypothetical protein